MILLLLFLICSIVASAQYPTYRGMYLNNLTSIIGNTTNENQVLRYAVDSGYNAMTIYDLPAINWTTQSNTLAAFFSKLRTAGITSIAGVVENTNTANNIKAYNNSRTNASEKFNVINVEFEFWSTTSISNMYCGPYLTPGGYTCDTAGAFKYYKTLLAQVTSIAHSCGATSEIYVGWFNQGQAQQMFNLVDRILVHAYRTSPADVFAYTQTRLSYLAVAPVTIGIIFSNESIFMGPWLLSNAQLDAWKKYLSDYNSSTAAWKSNVNLIGYQWFKWSLFVKPVYTSTCGTPDVNTFTSSAITTSSAHVTWGAVSGATSYNVQYRVRNTTAYISAGSTSNTYTDITGLQPATNYEFSVQASCAGSTGSYSATGWFTTLSVPVSICGNTATPVISNVTATGCNVSWQGGTNNTSYVFQYKKTGSATWASVTTTNTSIPLSGLTPSTAYNIQVTGVCANGQSVATSGSFSTLSNYTCITPTGRYTSNLTSTTATLNWAASIVADSVIVRYRKSGTNTWTYRATVANNGTHSIKITSLTANRRYEWGAATKCGNTVGAFSSSLTFTTPANVAAARVAAPTETSLKMVAYPNHVTSDSYKINVTSDKDETCSLYMTDLNGRVVLTRPVDTQVGESTLDVPCAVNNGTYIVTLSCSQDQISQKLLVKKGIGATLPTKKVKPKKPEKPLQIIR